MMYLISYSLNPIRVNPGLIAELQSFDGWWHYLDDQWIIATSLWSNDVYQRLWKHLVREDSMLIIEIRQGADFNGWLPQDAWDWLNNTMPNWARS